MNTDSPDLYALRGVSSQKEDVHRAVKNLPSGLFPNAFCRVYPNPFSEDLDSCFVFHSDTAGSKPVLAYLLWKETGLMNGWDSIIQDALVMNTDDMACVGIIDRIAGSAVFSRNKNLVSGEVVARVIASSEKLRTEWQKWGIELILMGGETADVGDVVRTADAGFSLGGQIPRSEVIDCRFEAGNVIVGLASFGQTVWESEPNSGIGCNGLTSARHDLLSGYYAENYPETYDPLIRSAAYTGKYRLTDLSPEGTPIWKLLLSPTRTYLPFLKKVIPTCRNKISGIIHSTGGGQTKCLKFASDGIHIIKDRLFEPPEVFRLIRQQSGISLEEMYRTFNMGCRMEIYTDTETADELINTAESMNLAAQVIGRVEACEGTAQLSFENQGENWQIRKPI